MNFRADDVLTEKMASAAGDKTVFQNSNESKLVAPSRTFSLSAFDNKIKNNYSIKLSSSRVTLLIETAGDSLTLQLGRITKCVSFSICKKRTFGKNPIIIILIQASKNSFPTLCFFDSVKVFWESLMQEIMPVVREGTQFGTRDLRWIKTKSIF